MHFDSHIIDIRDPSWGFFILPTNAYSLTTLLLVVFVSLLTIGIIANKLKLNLFLSYSIYIWHSIFNIIYIIYVYYDKGDATKYFFRSLNEFHILNAVGAKFIVSFTAIFSQFFAFNYLSVFIIYNLIGTIALLLLVNIFINKKYSTDYKTKIIILIIAFLPSLSFWTSAIGKDTIYFFGTSLLLWTIFNLNKNILVKYFALILLFLIRPHYGFIGLAIFVFFDLVLSKSTIKTLYVKIFFIIFIVLISPFLFNYILNFVGYYSVTGYEHFHLEGFLNFLEVRSRYGFSEAFYDVYTMPFILKLISLLFRPFIFEANNIFQFIIALENLFLFLLIIYLIYEKIIIIIFKGIKFPSADRLTLYTYTFFYLFFLSISVANYGIASRQKWMILPVLIVLLLTNSKKYEK